MAISAPEAAVLATFHSEFASRGKARITLAVGIEGDEGRAVEFTGVFVATR